MEVIEAGNVLGANSDKEKSGVDFNGLDSGQQPTIKIKPGKQLAEPRLFRLVIVELQLAKR